MRGWCAARSGRVQRPMRSFSPPRSRARSSRAPTCRSGSPERGCVHALAFGCRPTSLDVEGPSPRGLARRPRPERHGVPRRRRNRADAPPGDDGLGDALRHGRRRVHGRATSTGTVLEVEAPKCRYPGHPSSISSLVSGTGPPIGSERSSEKLEVRTRVGAYPCKVSVAENPSESGNLTVVVPKDALLRAQALPSADDMAVEGVTAEEWDAFEQALADR
mgnify:CR=1 FL=1